MGTGTHSSARSLGDWERARYLHSSNKETHFDVNDFSDQSDLWAAAPMQSIIPHSNHLKEGASKGVSFRAIFKLFSLFSGFEFVLFTHHCMQLFAYCQAVSKQ